MTDCDNVDIRELLPDFAAGQLAPSQVVQVQSHVDSCAECAAELSIVQSVRAARLAPVPIDVQRIVAALPRAPQAHRDVRDVRDVRAIHDVRVKSPVRVRAPWRSRVWQLAAAIGVIVVGGGSMLVARNGGFVSVATLASDTTGPLNESTSTESQLDAAPSRVAELTSMPEIAVSFGNVGDYSDEELDRILERLDKWDGATSTESITTQPIVPVIQGGSKP